MQSGAGPRNENGPSEQKLALEDHSSGDQRQETRDLAACGRASGESLAALHPGCLPWERGTMTAGVPWVPETIKGEQTNQEITRHLRASVTAVLSTQPRHGTSSGRRGAAGGQAPAGDQGFLEDGGHRFQSRTTNPQWGHGQATRSWPRPGRGTTVNAPSTTTQAWRQGARGWFPVACGPWPVAVVRAVMRL